MKYRITVRGDGLELRGFADVNHLASFSDSMKPYGIVIASPMEGEPDDGQPTPEKSQTQIVNAITQTESIEQAVVVVSNIHYMQAMVIRGERDQREEEMRHAQERELHHFEVEQENARLEHDNQMMAARIERLERASNEQADVTLSQNKIIEKVLGVINAEVGWESPAVLIDRIQWALGVKA